MVQNVAGWFDGPPINYIRLALRARIPLASATIVFGVFGIAAGLTGFLKAFDGGAATHPITGGCLIGLGFAVLKTRRFGHPAWWHIGLLSAILTVCMARLMDAVVSGAGHTTQVTLFGPMAGFDGTFSIEAAVVLGGFAAAILIRNSNTRLGGVFLTIGLVMAFLTTLQMSYRLTLFGGTVGAFTILGLLSASAAMLTMFLHRPFVRVVFLMGDIGAQTRVMVGAILSVSWIAGMVLTRGPLNGDIMMIALPLSAMTCAMLAILLVSSARHEGSVASRRRAERDLAMRSRIDPMTGALNRFGMTEVVEGAWVDFRSSGAQFGMILMDVDYFRKIDATFGVGDPQAALRHVAQTVQDQLRGTDALGIWGADEFLILLKIKDVSNIDIVANRVRQALADPEGVFCKTLTMLPASFEIPMGISDMRTQDDAPTAALTRADHGLHLSRSDKSSTIPIVEVTQEDDFVFDPATINAFEADIAADVSGQPETETVDTEHGKGTGVKAA